MTMLDDTDTLVVPKWEIYDSTKEREYYLRLRRLQYDDYRKGLLVRSSSRDEDWLDSKSGTFETQPFKQGLALPEIPHVIQEKAIGFGLVVDVVYSDMLQKQVVRIASGGTKVGGAEFLSATADTESGIGIWDPDSGELMFQHNSYLWARPDSSLFSEHGGRELMGNIAKTIYGVTQKAGIAFGMQFEVVVDPDKPSEVNLVQMRPTPGKMQGDISERQEAEGEKRFYTPVVSGVIDSTLPVRHINADGDELADAPNSNWVQHLTEEATRERRSDDRHVAIIEDRLRLDTRTCDYYRAALFIQGADVQIASAPIQASSYHGNFNVHRSAGYESVAAAVAYQESGFMAFPRSVMEQIQNAVLENPDLIASVKSDGIVGELVLQ